MAIFTNQATLTYGTNVVNSNVAVGNLIEVITATKTAIDTTYTVGSPVTYAISVFNSGTTPFTGLTVTDNLGAYPYLTTTAVPLDYVPGSVRYFVNGVPQPAPTVAGENPLTVTGINVPAGGNAMILYEARTNRFAPPTVNGSVTNEARVTGAGLTTPAVAVETITAVNGPVLDIAKAITPTTVTENSPVTYTFTLRNTGNAAATAATDVAVTDTFNPTLTGLTVEYNGIPLTAGIDYTYNETTGAFATVPGRLTVPEATFTQDPGTGAYTAQPGTGVLTVTGTI